MPAARGPRRIRRTRVSCSISFRSRASRSAISSPGARTIRDEYMSPTHTVSCNASIRLSVGDAAVHQSPQSDLHDPPRRRRQARHHRSLLRPRTLRARLQHARPPHCLGNLKQARDLLKVKFDIHGEQAWNVFMHNRVTAEGAVVTDAAAIAPGSTITLRAEMDFGRAALGLSAGPHAVQRIQPDGDEACGPRRPEGSQAQMGRRHMELRKILTFAEEAFSEAGRAGDPPLRKVAVVAVLKNPFAGGYAADLSELTDASLDRARGSRRWVLPQSRPDPVAKLRQGRAWSA